MIDFVLIIQYVILDYCNSDSLWKNWKIYKKIHIFKNTYVKLLTHYNLKVLLCNYLFYATNLEIEVN